MSGDYFANHARALRFPWSLYHRPLERSLAGFLTRVGAAGGRPRVLVIGGGFLHELPLVPEVVRLTVVDVDPRVTERLDRIGDPRVERCLTIAPNADLRPLGEFEGIYAKEVIEHIPAPEPYLAAIAAMLAPEGRLWLSTPNYGDAALPLLEATVLELVGRLSGYSRRDIHPSRFTADRLLSAMREAGLDEVEVTKTPLRLALVGQGRRAA
ncbi:MAG: class I SAM-dependent methyltransferase [Deltaproteobacteria bacterium]|nr:class I SAM-dependent methyltransferase [Deltaproteobacteria bacterium]